MFAPVTGAQLQQFLCALQWVKNAIPLFSAIPEPLHLFTERVDEQGGKRTKRAVSNVDLNAMGWGTSRIDSFNKCKDALANQVTISHRNTKKRLCVYTDASDLAWSGIVTQVDFIDLSKPHLDQSHEPLAFLSGRFNATQLR